MRAFANPHHSKQLTRKSITDKDQFNIATIFFRKVADILSELAQSDFEIKIKLFHEIHDVIKKEKSVELMQSLATFEIVPSSFTIQNPTDSVIDLVSPVDEVVPNSTMENKVKCQ